MAIYKGYSSVGRNFSGTEVVDTALVRADLLNHFNTRQGERVMQPNFGIALRQFLFEPFSDDLIIQVQDTIINQMNLWLPFVVITSLSSRSAASA